MIERDGKRFKLFYGMSSTTAMEKHRGMVAEYRSSEGKTVEVPYRGPVEGTIQDILGGLRSACTYVGASTIKEISKRTTFIRVTQQLNPVFAQHRDESRLPQSYFTKLREGSTSPNNTVSSSSADGDVASSATKRARTGE